MRGTILKWVTQAVGMPELMQSDCLKVSHHVRLVKAVTPMPVWIKKDGCSVAQVYGRIKVVSAPRESRRVARKIARWHGKGYLKSGAIQGGS